MADQEHKERQQALEEKKRKLAEMRAAKMQRQREDRGGVAGLRPDSAVSSRATMTPAELDAMMADLGIQQRMHREEAPSDPSSTNSTSRECNGTLHPDGAGAGHSNDVMASRRSGKRPHQLELIPVQTVIAIQPKHECMSYCKTTQTDEERRSHGEFSMGSQDLDFDDELSLDDGVVIGQNGSFDESPTHEIRKHLKNLHFPFTSHLSQKEAPDDKGPATAKQLPPISDEERRKILSSAEFGRFFQQASRVMERALAEDSDIFIDYVTGGGGASAGDDKFDKRELLTLSRTIFDDKHTAGRGVRALDFSTFFPELVAVSYDRNRDAPHAPESVINVWNTRFNTKSPEMTFHSSSRVMSMVFDAFQSNIIIGGCYSGQICIWDTRANKRMPVCKTGLSMNAHTQPVLCMRMVGSANAHDLITISTDGRFCSWSVGHLQQPIESTNLICKSKRQVSALSLAFVHNSINNFVVGSEENDLCIGDRHASKGEMNRITPASISAAHQMPVTTVDTHHASSGPIDFSSLCLTGSMDFGIKLWNIKDPSKTDPLLSLDRKHKLYVNDVQWSPVHPAVFASLSSDGTLNLWNLNVNTENPVTSMSLGDSGTKFRWNRNGQQIVVGDESGAVHLFDVHESLYNVRSGEWDDLKSNLNELVADEAAPIGQLH